jgi:hypothetical protein
MPHMLRGTELSYITPRLLFISCGVKMPPSVVTAVHEPTSSS